MRKAIVSSNQYLSIFLSTEAFSLVSQKPLVCSTTLSQCRWQSPKEACHLLLHFNFFLICGDQLQTLSGFLAFTFIISVGSRNSPRKPPKQACHLLLHFNFFSYLWDQLQTLSRFLALPFIISVGSINCPIKRQSLRTPAPRSLRQVGFDLCSKTSLACRKTSSWIFQRQKNCRANVEVAK